jgi:hypothetical protein
MISRNRGFVHLTACTAILCRAERKKQRGQIFC